MASGKERDQTQIDDPVFAHYHPAHRAEQPLVDLPDLYLTFDPTPTYGYPSRIRRYNATSIDAASACGTSPVAPHTSSPEATEANRSVTLITITLLQYDRVWVTRAAR